MPVGTFPEATGFAATYRPMIDAMPPAERLENLSSKQSPLNLNEAAASGD